MCSCPAHAAQTARTRRDLNDKRAAVIPRNSLAPQGPFRSRPPFAKSVNHLYYATDGGVGGVGWLGVPRATLLFFTLARSSNKGALRIGIGADSRFGSHMGA